jgi:hypothetical protein
MDREISGSSQRLVFKIVPDTEMQFSPVERSDKSFSFSYRISQGSTRMIYVYPDINCIIDAASIIFFESFVWSMTLRLVYAF